MALIPLLNSNQYHDWSQEWFQKNRSLKMGIWNCFSHLTAYKDINSFTAMVNSKLVVHDMQWQTICKLSPIVTYD